MSRPYSNQHRRFNILMDSNHADIVPIIANTRRYDFFEEEKVELDQNARNSRDTKLRRQRDEILDATVASFIADFQRTGVFPELRN